MEELGYALRLARERRGLTQTQVMNLTGINNKTLSGYENNIAEPDLQTLTTLLRLYRVSADRLLHLPVSAQELPADEVRLLTLYRAFPEEQRQQAEKGHRRELFPADLLDHRRRADKLPEIPEQEGGAAAVTDKSRTAQAGGVPENEHRKEHQRRCCQHIPQQGGADGAALPCPEDDAAQLCCRNAEGQRPG